MPADYVPGRLLHVTPGSYFSWPRGWMPEKTPWRADLLDTMHPDVGRYVPTRMAYYDDNFLPESCRRCLYVAEWGKGELFRYPLRPQGASFKVDQVDFLTAPPTVRPVGVAVGRGGRIFVTLCHMKGNEASPRYASDLIMVTRDIDPDSAPFDGYDETSVPVEKLYAELASDSWNRRYRAHVELLRRGPSTAICPASPTTLPGPPSPSSRRLALATPTATTPSISTTSSRSSAPANTTPVRPPLGPTAISTPTACRTTPTSLLSKRLTCTIPVPTGRPSPPGPPASPPPRLHPPHSRRLPLRHFSSPLPPRARGRRSHP
jgi:hypothetical protein